MAIHTCDTQSRTFWYHVVTPILLKTAFEVAMVVFGEVKVVRPAALLDLRSKTVTPD